MAKRTHEDVIGTRVGRDWHRRGGTDVCDECRLAWNEYSKQRQRAARERGWKRGPRAKTVAGECQHCGGQFSAEQAQPFCSHRCHMRSRYPRSRELVHIGTREIVAPPAPTTIVSMPKWWDVIVNGPCDWCGETFTATGATTWYCSAQCARSSYHARRGGKFVVKPTVRLAIYERDSWTCQLCMEPIDREAHYLEPWAPTLDHIIPQSHQLIPDHSPEALRTAHRWCNAVRGDGAGDYLFEAVSQ